MNDKASPDGSVLRPSIVFAMVDILSKLLALAVVAIVGRRLSPTGFGDVVASLALASILATVLDLGVNTRLVGLVVSDLERARQAVARRYHVLAFALVLGVVGCIPSQTRLVSVTLVAAVFMAALPVGALLAAGRTAWAAAALAVPNGLFLVALVASGPRGSVQVLWMWAASNLITLVWLWWGVPWLRPAWSVPMRLGQAYRESLPIGIFNGVVLGYGRVDAVLVAVMVGSAAAGVYGTYYRVVLAVVSLASWSAAVVARRLGEEATGGAHLRRLLWGLAIVSVPVAALTFVALPPVVSGLLGYPASIPVAARAALALLLIPTMAINALVLFLVVRGRQHRLTVAALLVGATAACAYPIGIATSGVTGAAAASLLIETIACAVFLREAKLALHDVTPRRRLRTTVSSVGRSAAAQAGLLAAMAVLAWLASTQPVIAVGAAAAIAVVGCAARWPAATSAALMGAYLIPLFAFGRVYAYTGFDPVYLPEVLLLSALALSLPLWWKAYLTAVPRWYRWASAGFALVALVALNTGFAQGYPDALKGLVFVVYPLASGPCAAWISVHTRYWRRIAVAAAVAAPVGLLILTVTDPTAVIPAAYGFYLAGLVALAASWRPTAGRWALVAAACVGPVLLIATSRRGPTLTLIVVVVVALIASRRMASRPVRPLVIACTLGIAALTFVFGFVGVAPSRLPVVGTTVQRTSQSVGDQGGESEANVAFRFDLWRYSMESALHDGFWVGTGFGRPFDFRFRTVDYRTVATGGPHNSFVGVFYYMGVPAGLGFIAIVVAAFRSVGRRRDPELAPIQLALLAGAVTTLLTNVALEAPYIGGPLWILIAWSVLARPARVPGPAERRRLAHHG